MHDSGALKGYIGLSCDYRTAESTFCSRNGLFPKGRKLNKGMQSLLEKKLKYNYP